MRQLFVLLLSFTPVCGRFQSFFYNNAASFDVSVDKECYRFKPTAETITVSFESSDPLSRDWIGIYPANANPQNLGNPLLWLYTCSSQFCSGARAFGELEFGYGGQVERGVTAFPLLPGSYKAVLVRNSYPYRASSQSDVFQVGGCGRVFDIIEILEEEGNFETLLVALREADLDTVLSSDEQFTLFAPNDEAFGRLPAGTVSALLDSPDQLSNILLYHVVSGGVLSTQLSNGEVSTLQGSTVDIAVSQFFSASPTITVNDATVIDADIKASNGVIHEIDAVLLPPPSEPTQAPTQPVTIFQVLQRIGRFNILLGALTSTGLDQVLEGDGPFTLFAPNDDAFAALDPALLASLDEAALADILLYHVLPAEIESGDFNDGLYTTANDDQIDVDVQNNGSIEINDAADVINGDIEASNGIIHEIDMVLLPPSGDDQSPDDSSRNTIVDVLREQEGFSSLLLALETAGLDEALQGDGPFTLFAPTDNAFALLGQTTVRTLLEENSDLLGDILLGHVLSNELSSRQIRSRDYTTLNNEVISVEVRNNGAVVINENSNVVDVDLEASNGIIHVINTVLLPRSTPVVTSKMIYDVGETVKVLFSNLSIRDGDFIGIYRYNDNLSGNPRLWLYTCGTQTCYFGASSGVIGFGSGGPNESWLGSSFPLSPGFYVAVLSRGRKRPYTRLARSESFRIG